MEQQRRSSGAAAAAVEEQRRSSEEQWRSSGAAAAGDGPHTHRLLLVKLQDAVALDDHGAQRHGHQEEEEALSRATTPPRRPAARPWRDGRRSAAVGVHGEDGGGANTLCHAATTGGQLRVRLCHTATQRSAAVSSVTERN